ncbi:MAG: hypothetical protein RBT36_11595 [Desulfobulbus sp.]|jgi:hypothetical protein|nr:hypothetical protein [Desulfobulbus sp.]
MNINPSHTTRMEHQPVARERVNHRHELPPQAARPERADTVRLSSAPAPAPTYAAGVQRGGREDIRFETLRQLVASLLKEQGVNTKIAAGTTGIDLAGISPQEAQELISQDGYFGIEQNAERIFQFAVGIAGGNPARLDAIKQGIDRGFAEAKKALGNWLPDISLATYDAVMTKLDEWASPTATAV